LENAFIHIGYPKCASTALQVNYFTKHPELFYLGPYNGGLTFDYYNSDVTNLVEIDWRLMKDFGYDREKAANTIRKCHRDFLASRKKKFGFSFESLAFTMHHDIDVTQKAQRMAEVFGHGTKIVIVIRNQFDLIKSLYRELIIVGLTSTYHKFISDIFYNKFRSFVFDFNFFKMHGLYAQHFGAENVLVLPYEQLKHEPKAFFEALSGHLGVKPGIITSIPRENESRSEAFYEHYREMNNAVRHGVGLGVGEPVNQYRYSEYFREVDGIAPPPTAEVDMKMMPLLRDLALEKARNSKLKIQYDMPPDIEQWLTHYYGQSNAELAKAVNLPLEKMGYPQPLSRDKLPKPVHELHGNKGHKAAAAWQSMLRAIKSS
jgi:hypothetical protein